MSDEFDPKITFNSGSNDLEMIVQFKGLEFDIVGHIESADSWDYQSYAVVIVDDILADGQSWKTLLTPDAIEDIQVAANDAWERHQSEGYARSMVP